MTFQDIFKSSFWRISPASPYWTWRLPWYWPFCWDCLSFLSIRKATAASMYSASFGVTLIALSLITTLLIMTCGKQHRAVSGHGGRSVHCPGSARLSRSLWISAFLFWAIAVWHCAGGGPDPAGVFGSIFIGAVLFAFSKKKTADSPYILCGALRKQRNRRADPGFREISGQAAESQEQKRGRRLCGTQL